MTTSILIACETIREELEKTLQHLWAKVDLVWMSGKLHTSPENLRGNLQTEINKHDGLYDEIILSYGFCGGGVEKLQTTSSLLIIPKVEDCISILLGGDCERARINQVDKPLFLTKGWIRSFNQMEGLNIKYLKRKYDEELACDLFRKIYNGYCNINIIDTDAYSIKEIDEGVAEIQAALKIPCNQIASNLVFLERMVAKQWGDDFVVKNPGQQVEKSDFC